MGTAAEAAILRRIDRDLCRVADALDRVDAQPAAPDTEITEAQLAELWPYRLYESEFVAALERLGIHVV